MQLEPGKTAIVLVEFQKQWTEKGLFNWLIQRQLAARRVVENTQRLVSKAREAGWPVIHAPLVVDPQNKKGWMAHLTFGCIFTKGSWKSELVSGLFAEGDPIALRQYYNYQAFDAFYKSGLEQTLRQHNIQNLLICGFATDQCPSKTLATAVRKGFNSYLVTDCTATFNHFFQKNAEHKHKERTVTSQEVLEMVAGSH